MAVRPILRYPDPCLATPAAPVQAITDEIRAIWDDMVDTMEAMPGWGLAAPQIGISLRLAVVDVSDARGQVIRMANPEIVPEDGAQDLAGTEGSPCLPGLQLKIKRFNRVRARYLDETGAQVDRVLEGNWAISAQHQLDHLNGKLILDRLSRTKRDIALRKYRKLKG